MHATPRLAVAVGLLGIALTGCQVPARDQHLLQALPDFLRTARPAATPSGATLPTARLRPAPARAPAEAANPATPEPEVPPQLSGPDAVAAQLTSAERAIAAAPASPRALRQAAHAQQSALDAVACHPDWRDPVSAKVPPALQPAVQAETTAAVDLRQLNRASDDLPHWQVTAPPPAADLLAWYHEAERQSGIPWSYLAAVNLVETRMGRIHADSIAGAQGPMQFMPDTWQQYGNGGDVQDPHAAILAAGRFLQVAGGPQDMAKALHEYNPSDLYVEAVSAYAQRMQSDPKAFLAYYDWQADAAITSGDVLLPTGFSH